MAIAARRLLTRVTCPLCFLSLSPQDFDRAKRRKSALEWRKKKACAYVLLLLCGNALTLLRPLFENAYNEEPGYSLGIPDFRQRVSRPGSVVCPRQLVAFVVAPPVSPACTGPVSLCRVVLCRVFTSCAPSPPPPPYFPLCQFASAFDWFCFPLLWHQSLREKCLNFILGNFDAVTKTPDFEEMGRTNIELVFEILRNR